MVQSSALQALILQHAERIAPHADLFARTNDAAMESHEELVRRSTKAFERRNAWAPPGISSSVEEPRDESLETLRGRVLKRLDAGEGRPAVQRQSRVAIANTLQPVRDVVIEGLLVLSQDRLLDIIGPPYPNSWTHKSGNILPAQQSVWARTGDGSFGFEHLVDGTVTGRQGNSGAGIFVQFVPRIAPGMAQIRPFAPFSYQWSSVSYKSREDNRATFAVRVWSWDLTGGDFTTELDYRYFVWNESMIARHFGVLNSPSWDEDQGNYVPEWDSDSAFLWGSEAPYFRTRPSRIYQAAIWCLGMVWSISPENRPGEAIGRLHAKVPWVVIGYQ